MSKRDPKPATRDADLATARRARTIGVIMAVTMIAYVGLQFAGAALGLPQGLAFVFDAIALAVFVWALAATFRIWQKRNDRRT